MSVGNVRVQINNIRKNMTASFMYYDLNSRINERFLRDILLLQQAYGEFLGNAKAKHQEYWKQISELDNNITDCFAELTAPSHYTRCFSITNLAVGKISEMLSFVETLESTPAEDKVSKAAYDKLLREKEAAEKTAKFLVQYKGLPELHVLIENAKTVGISIDEN